MTEDQAVTELLKIITTLSEQDISALSGDTLSRLLVKVASLKARLGVLVAESRRVTWDAEAEYIRVRAEEYKKLREEGKGSTDADELKRLGAHDAFVNWSTQRYNQERLSQLSMDCHDLIDSVRGRLINLQSERTESNAY